MKLQGAKQFFADLSEAFRAWQRDDGILMSGAVAYYASLSFLPLLLVLLACLGMFFNWTAIGEDSQRDLLQAIGALTSPQLQPQIRELLDNVGKHGVVGGPLGMVGLGFTALVLFAQFERAFDHIWRTGKRHPNGLVATVRHILMFRLRAFLMLVILGSILVVVFVAGMTLATIQAATDGVFPMDDWLWWFVQIIVNVVINAAVITCLYKWLPRTDVAWADALAGGVLTALIWEAGRILLATLVIGSRLTNAYGMIGTFIGVMLWFYYAGAIIFLGAEYVQIIRARRKDREHRKPA